MQVWDIELLWRGSDSLLGEGDKWEGSGMPLPVSKLHREDWGPQGSQKGRGAGCTIRFISFSLIFFKGQPQLTIILSIESKSPVEVNN